MGTEHEKKEIREPSVAGSFYPGDKSSLSREVEKLLEMAGKRALKGKILGVIVPHAGYVFSGLVAAHAYRQLEGLKFDVAVLIGPSHRAYHPEASIYPGRAFKTPLGLVEVDADIARELASRDPLMRLTASGHTGEHSIEVQLPFLQKVMPDIKIVPIALGIQNRVVCEKIAGSLKVVLKGKKAILIASSDLSHFHGYDEAVRLDRIVLKHLESFDATSLLMDLETDTCEACGGGAIATVLLAAKSMGGNSVEILKYANSGDAIGDRRSVVGYAAAAVMGPAT
ncbi:MAG: AmmeMemoRadiSam system protein B [Candidatus Eisenbacteria bacterium]|nr:AmmeMemoRadiSam system protein B [Candidatus Eisenbacteria bacterium]